MPVAAEGETVAVSVMLVPTVVVLLGVLSVVVVAVVPPEPLDPGACQKSPQPVSGSAAISVMIGATSGAASKRRSLAGEAEFSLITFACCEPLSIIL